jgi:flagellar biosynthetic protein FliR
MFQVGLTLAMTVMVVSYSDIALDFTELSILETFVVMLKELFVGFTLGAIVSLFTYVVILGGEFIDMQMALSMSKMYDPQSGIQMSVTATYFNLMFIFMFFGMNAHLTLIHLFLSSAKVLPYGAVTFVNQDLTMEIINVFCQCTILGLKIAMPIAGMVFFLEMGVGILMKTIPQINVFIVNLQLKILTGLLMVMVIFTPLSKFLEDVITTLFYTMGNILFLL